MKWLKKQFNKVFFAIEEEDLEYYEEDVQIAQPTEPQIHNEQQHIEQKKKFNFPLVKDEETFTKLPKEEDTETSYYENGKLQLPNHLKQDGGVSKVYDIEVSGIRDLLERRQKSGNSSRVVYSSEEVKRHRSVTKEELDYLTNKKVQKVVPEKRVDPVFTSPVQKRKRFVPTHVPSPVHGFQKHTMVTMKEDVQEGAKQSISNEEEQPKILGNPQVLKTEVVEENLTDENVRQTSGKDQTADTEKTQSLNASEISVAILTEQTSNPLEEQADYKQDVEMDALQDSDVNALQVEQLTVHNSTIHIEQLNVQETPPFLMEEPVNEQIDGIANENVTELTETVENKSTGGSRLPFNVLMLKSDKQKLAAQQMMQQFEVNNKFKEMAPNDVHSNYEPISFEGNLVDQLEVETAVVCMETSNNIQEQQQSSEEEPTPPIMGNDLGTINTQPNEDSVQVEEMIEIKANDEFYNEEPIQDSLLDKTISVEELDQTQLVKEDIPNTSELIQSKNENVQKTVQFVEPLIKDREQLLKQPSKEIFEGVVEEVEVATETKTTEQQSFPLVNELLNEPMPYHKPPHSILAPPEEMLEDTEWMEEQGYNLVEALSHFQVQAQVETVVQGPAVTQFEITVGHGTKVSKVRNLSDDIQLALAARDIRIDAPIPGKRSIGIEIPNRVSRAVRLSEVTDTPQFMNSDSPLEAALGLDLNGKPVTLDLRKMPHGLIAGATGSGKSVCINSILVSLLYKSAPHELKLMLIDPKMVELAPFNHIPHLVCPVITDVKAATESLKWAVDEMERRYQLFMHSGTRDITRYNKLCDENKMYAQKLPYLLIVIDELADLMMMSPADVELAISRLAQKARACGIHLILATQRPSVDVITGTLKSNIPTRIAFAVSSQIDSRTIIDQQGAERLLGRGDMLYLGNGMNAPQRIQGTYVTDEEIEEVVEYVRSQGKPNYFFKSEELVQKSEITEEQDELFEEVCRFVYSQGSASTSALQRRYHIGYNRAARLIDMLEDHGFISEQKGSKPRDVYITETILEDTF